MDKTKTIHISIEDQLAIEYVKENEEYFQELFGRINDEESRKPKISHSVNIYERDTRSGFKR
tara:strand:- start:643 stop:828 length:186 start_codon:yes stop_codon:yes gene_type:complete